MTLREIFTNTAKVIAVTATLAMPVSFLSGVFTDSQQIPNLLKTGARVAIDVPNDVGVWVRKTAVPFILSPLN